MLIIMLIIIGWKEGTGLGEPKKNGEKLRQRIPKTTLMGNDNNEQLVEKKYKERKLKKAENSATFSSCQMRVKFSSKTIISAEEKIFKSKNKFI